MQRTQGRGLREKLRAPFQVALERTSSLWPSQVPFLLWRRSLGESSELCPIRGGPRLHGNLRDQQWWGY